MGNRASTAESHEAGLVEAARNGDLPSFNALVLSYQTRVYNLCLRMLGDPDAAEDATQEAFISAYRAIKRFKGEHFRTWLFRIATNECLDALRSRKRKPTTSLFTRSQEGDEESEPLPIADLDPTIDPESLMLRAEVVEAIQQALASLPDDQRIALVLVDVQGLSYEEAASVTGSNLGTIKSRINRGRARMRDYLRDKGVLPGATFDP